MTRENGYYWVKIHEGDEWEVARLFGTGADILGCEVGMSVKDFYEINETRILAPYEDGDNKSLVRAVSDEFRKTKIISPPNNGFMKLSEQVTPIEYYNIKLPVEPQEITDQHRKNLQHVLTTSDGNEYMQGFKDSIMSIIGVQLYYSHEPIYSLNYKLFGMLAMERTNDYLYTKL